MPRPLTSWVWEHCQRSQDGNEATCNLCQEVLHIRGSTSSVIKHLTVLHSLATSEHDADGRIPQKRSRYITLDDNDNAMDMDISSDSVDSLVVPVTSNSVCDRADVETSNENNDSNTSTFSRPGTSGDRVWLQSCTPAPLRNNATANLQAYNRVARTTASQGRIRSIANAARVDRPCNRDRIELISQALTKMIIVDMLPISFVESPGFREFMAILEPNYKVPCAKTIKNRLAFSYEQVAAKVASELSKVPFVAWTSDCWSSRSQDSYISVTAHYLDLNWTPKNCTLATEELSEQHTAANLTNRLQSVMAHWQLDGKVTAVVTDNAQAAKNSVRDLDHVYINEGVTCAAHSLQLCVTKALKNTDGADLCEKASRVVAHFRHSNVASSALEKKQDQLNLPMLKLIQRCITRWHSSFAMIERLLINRAAVTNVLTDRAITKPAIAERLEISEREWLSLEKLQVILKPLQVATTVLCSDTYSPISMVRPIIYTLRENHLCESADDDDMISDMKKTLRLELTTRFDLEYDHLTGVNARQVASFLDPRYKDLLVESVDARNDIRSFVRGLLTGESMDDEADESHITAMDFLFQTAPQRNSAETQFEMYLAEPQISHNTNPFEWWATREKRYPALAELARKYLCIPATSASSERVFSTAGNVVSSKRNCLLPENVNILVFLYQNRRLLQA